MKQRKVLSFFLALFLILNSIMPGLEVYALNNVIYEGRTSGESQEVTSASANSNQPVNVLLGKSITASSVEAAVAINTADKAIDGNTDTRWSSERMKNSGVSDNDPQTPQWLVIDLQSEKTIVTELEVAFYLKVWATKYKIQTASTNDATTSWETVHTTERSSENKGGITDTITDVTELKRYVRFYFEKVNVFAGGTGVSVVDITMMGIQEDIIENPLANYHRIFNSADTEGIELLYGNDATFAGQNDGLLLTYTANRAGIVDKNMPQISDGVFEATVIPKENGARFGLIMRATGLNKKLLVGTENSNNKWFWEFWNGSGQGTWSSTFTGPALALNQEAKIKVELLGTSLTLWVNDTKVFTEALPDTVLMEKGYFGFDKSNSAGSYLVKEIKITERKTAASVLHGTGGIPEIKISDSFVPLPEVEEGYSLKVSGSDREGVITNEGKITGANIGDIEVGILVDIVNDSNPEDKARRKFTVTVPSKNSKRPEIFREVSSPNEKPVIIPSIQEWYGYEEDFRLNSGTKIIIKDDHNLDLLAVAENLKTDLKEITGLTLPIVLGEFENNSIYLESLAEDVYGTGEEGYFSITDNQGVKIYSHTYTGTLYGTITVEQILWRDDIHRNIPCGVIRDYPDYEIRGVMFDVGRIPHRIQYLKDYVKILNWYKMSEFHLHMNDDFKYSSDVHSTGWTEWTGMHRLESGIYPSLTDRRVYGDNDYFNNEYADPVYTKDEYRELERLSDSRGIELIAEFDTPSHATAYIEYANENPDEIEWLGPINTTNTANPSGFAPNSEQMLALNINHSNDQEKQNAINARRFIQELYKDYLAGDNPTFTSDTVHVGVDEYWDTSDKESFREYANFLSDLMKQYGKTARMWGSFKKFSGSTYINPENIVLDVWNISGEEDPLARLAEGFRIVNVPQPILYTTPGRDHKDMVVEEHVYKKWDVNMFNESNGIDKAEPLLLGAKTALWGDEFREGMVEADLHERMLRAVAITAEKTWGGQEADDNYIDYQMAFEELKEGPGTQIANHIKSKTEIVAEYDLANAKDEDNKLVIEDSTKNGYHAYVTGGSLVTVDGKSMVEFDGNTLMTTPLQSLKYPYTISFDIRAKDGNTSSSMLFSGYDGQLRAADENGNVTIKRSFYTHDSGYKIPTDRTVTITIVGNFQNTKLYADGELVKTFQATSATDAMTLGEHWTTFVLPLEEIGKGFKGYIGNIKIFNKSFPRDVFVNYDTVEEVNVALNKEAYAERFGNQPALNSGALKRHPSWKATDGDIQDTNSYWYSSNHNNDYLMVDLERIHKIHKVKVVWNGNQYATAFKVLISEDGKTFNEVKSITGNTSSESVIDFTDKMDARFVKIQGVARNGNQHYGIKELEVYEATELARAEIEEILPDDSYDDGSGSDNDDGSGSGNDDGGGSGNDDGSGSGNDDGSGSDNDDGSGSGNDDGSGSDNDDGSGSDNDDGSGSDNDDGSDKDNSDISRYEGLWITGISEEYHYTGTAIKPEIQVYDGDRLLIEKKDYTLVHKNNKNAYDKDTKDKKTPYVEIRMKGNNTGNKKVYYKIMPVDLSETQLVEDKLTAVVKSGKTANVTPVLYWQGKKLKLNKDYTIEGNIKKLAAGKHTIDIVGKGNFTGKIAKVDILISDGKDVSGNTVIAMDKVKIKANEKKLTWKEEGAEFSGYTLSAKPVAPAAGEYEAKYYKNEAAGTGFLVIRGTGIDANGDKNVFLGTKTVTFKIDGTVMNTKNITFTGFEGWTYAYGKAIRPTEELDKDGNYKASLSSGGKTLEEGVHYNVVYSKNIEKGTATATFTGIPSGGFTGTVKKTFKIDAAPIGDLDYVVSGNDVRKEGEVYHLSFTKGATTPTVSITTENGRELVAGKDYTIKYKDNKKVGATATATITGKGNYGGTETFKFVLDKKEFSNENGIQIVAKDKVDNGKANNWNTSVKVLDSNGKALTKKDYEIVSYIVVASEKGTVGTEMKKGSQAQLGDVIEVTVKGKGDYASESTASGTYRMLAKGNDISKASFKLNSKAYTGDAIEITAQTDFDKAIVNPGKRTLVLGKDMEVVEGSYVKNVEKGTAKVTVRGIGEFGGTKTVTFKILPRDTRELWEIAYRLLFLENITKR